MLGRSRILLPYEGLDAVLSSPLNMSMSSLLSTYLHFVPIQAIYISELHPERIMNKKSLLSRVECIVQDLLDKLEDIRQKITVVGIYISRSGLRRLTMTSCTEIRILGPVCTSVVNCTPYSSPTIQSARLFCAQDRSVCPTKFRSTMTV
jgi:hypothetical protein